MIRLSAFLLAVLFAAPAIAETPSFTFLQAGYQWLDIKVSGSPNVDADGWGVGGSFEIGNSLFVFAQYASGNADFGVDLEETQAGIGVHRDVGEQTALFVTLAYAEAKASASGVGSAKEDGYAASAGFRGNAGELVEITIDFSYVDLGSGSTNVIGTEVMFNLTDRFAVGANISYDDDVTSYGAGARLYFGS